MPLTLTITDNLNGTGGVATVAGSLGAENSLYASLFTGQMGSLSMALAGSRTGDGVISLAMPKGFRFFQLTSGGVLGPACYQNFSDSTLAVHDRILDAVCVRIASTGVMASNKIVRKWIPKINDPEILNLPLIFVAVPDAEKVKADGAAVTRQDDLEFPVVVAIVEKGNQDSVANQSPILKIRDRIIRSMIAQRLSGIPEVWSCNVYFDVVVNPDWFVTKNLIVSQVGFGFVARQTRGLV